MRSAPAPFLVAIALTLALGCGQRPERLALASSALPAARRGEGQVTVALTQRGAVVGWLEEGRTWARTVGLAGRAGAPLDLGPSPPHTRLPRWIGTPEGTLAVWNGLGADRVRRIQAGVLTAR